MRARTWLERLAPLALVGLWACESPEDPAASTAATESDSGEEVLPRSCIAPPGLGAPSDIAGVVALVNAFEPPVTLPCFLESLDRPFQLYASSSAAAAQPAVGERSPRLFIHRGDLIMTVVPEGIGRPKLELSMALPDRKSVKAEIAFPVVEPLTPWSPYEQIYVGNGTSCGVCHQAESRYEPIQETIAYQSEAFQDDEEHRIPLAFAKAQARGCDAAVEPDRCAMLQAVFGHGDLEPWEVPRDLKICRGY